MTPFKTSQSQKVSLPGGAIHPFRSTGWKNSNLHLATNVRLSFPVEQSQKGCVKGALSSTKESNKKGSASSCSTEHSGEVPG